MRVVLQRVRSAAVSVDGAVTGRIDHGLMALVGVGQRSTDADAEWLAAKTQDLRIFSDEQGRMNRSVRDVGGGILAISQFTLYGDARKGRRPSFVAAAAPEHGAALYERYCAALEVPVGKGVFGADMAIDMVCDGPVTILLERGED
ncbi:D-aminoacyl-tRNA deacylase [Euzebya rosea]|uniref:D-aminoacyl-tRNA deacylase n=1 Tax=Euzebya rosea TaxID=2052804 RepID=UPI000D3E30BA|nr:D-aminoacyl-tRNA deacylase [Euzebya rosea]